MNEVIREELLMIKYVIINYYYLVAGLLNMAILDAFY